MGEILTRKPCLAFYRSTQNNLLFFINIRSGSFLLGDSNFDKNIWEFGLFLIALILTFCSFPCFIFNSSVLGHMLRGKVCIVTGASEGIGESIARSLAIEGGATVVLASRQLQRLQGIAENLVEAGCSKADILPLKCDVTDRKSVEEVVQNVMNHHGKIDVLVNCAGLMYYTLMKNMKVEVGL